MHGIVQKNPSIQTARPLLSGASPYAPVSDSARIYSSGRTRMSKHINRILAFVILFSFLAGYAVAAPSTPNSVSGEKVIIGSETGVQIFNRGSGAVTIESAVDTARYGMSVNDTTIDLGKNSSGIAWTVEADGDLAQGSTGGNIVLTTGTIAESAGDTISAAGTLISNATPLTKASNNVTTAATGSGVQLYETPIGGRIVVRNGGNGTALVYPPTASGTINQLAAGVGYMLPAQSVAIFSKITATVWIAALGAVQGFETGITAVGSGSGDAYALSRFANTITGGAGTTGAILPAATTVPVGVPVWIRNDSGSNKIIYPPSGGTLNGAASLTLATATGIACIRLTSTAWFTF